MTKVLLNNTYLVVKYPETILPAKMVEITTPFLIEHGMSSCTLLWTYDTFYDNTYSN